MHTKTLKIFSLPFIFFALVISFLVAYCINDYLNNLNHELISGINARVLDGDIIMLNDIVIRLEGIDAPESDQLCFNKKILEAYNCGLTTKSALKQLIKGKKVCCHKKFIDIYNRVIATCYIDDNIDIAKQLVQQGLALAYRKFSDSYVEDELYAKQNKLNIWNDNFITPWDYRYYIYIYTSTNKISEAM